MDKLQKEKLLKAIIIILTVLSLALTAISYKFYSKKN